MPRRRTKMPSRQTLAWIAAVTGLVMALASLCQSIDNLPFF
jgi:hypothetical protein